MIDWIWVLENSAWLAGLALIFSTFSLASYGARVQRAGPRPALATFSTSAWTLVGAILFCLGMALTAGSWLETVLWVALAPAAAILWALYRPASASARPTQDDTPEIDRNGEVVAGGQGFDRSIAEWIVRLELLWLLLLSPLFLFPASGGPGILAVAALPLIWIARRVARGRFVPATPIDWPVCLMMVMMVVSLFVTFDAAFSLGKVMGLLLGIGVYYAIVERLSSGHGLRWALAGYSAAGLILALVGLLATDWTTKFAFITRLVGNLPPLLKGLPGAESGINPNETAGALLWVLPVQLALVASLVADSLRPDSTGGSSPVVGRPSSVVIQAAAIAMAAISAGVLLLAESRAALAGMALGLIVLLGTLLRRTRHAAIAAGGLAVLLAGTILYIGPGNIVDSILAENASFGLGDYLRSAQSRVEIWSRALYGIHDFPLTGMGMNAFRRLMPALYPSTYPPNADLGHAHNQFFQVALDLGLPGLVAYVALWFVCIAMVVAVWRQSRRGWVRWLAGGIGGGLAAYALFGIVDTVALGAKPGIFFWGLIALLVAIWQRPRLAIEREPTLEEAIKAAGGELTGEHEAVMIQ